MFFVVFYYRNRPVYLNQIHNFGHKVESDSVFISTSATELPVATL